MKKILKGLTLILLILLLLADLVFIVVTGILLVSFLKTPQLNRDWNDDSKILPSITVSSSTVSVKNIRDWRYKPGEVVSRDYYDDTFDLNKIERAYLEFNPFGKWEGVGHSFLIFKFSDGKTIAISVEARREVGEDYDAIKKGLFNEYEAWYAIGSPADFMSRRAILNNEDLYQYPLLISTSTAKAFFLELVTQAKSIETKPIFYNTVTSNCTNLLADSANRVEKGSIPFNKARLFTGYADNHLYDLGLIPNDKPFKDVFSDSRVDELIRQKYLNNQTFSKEEFSANFLK